MEEYLKSLLSIMQNRSKEEQYQCSILLGCTNRAQDTRLAALTSIQVALLSCRHSNNGQFEQLLQFSK